MSYVKVKVYRFVDDNWLRAALISIYLYFFVDNRLRAGLSEGERKFGWPVREPRSSS